jgi:hypothetical protein
MDVYAELSARQQRPAHPTMAAVPSISTPHQQHQPPHNISPKMKFPLAPMPDPISATVAVPPTTRSSQDTLSSPASPQRVQTTLSTGSSPTKTSSSSSSYEFPPTFTQFHPSNKPTAPLYRPAALRSADHPAPPLPFPRQNSFSFKDNAPPIKRDHWKVEIAAPSPFSLTTLTCL